MLNEPTKIGILVGLFVAALALMLHAYRRVPPRLNEISILLLASVGGTVGFDFGYTVATANAQYLGNLERYRLAMILGGVAVVWVSLEAVIERFLKISRRPAGEIPDQESLTREEP